MTRILFHQLRNKIAKIACQSSLTKQVMQRSSAVLATCLLACSLPLMAQAESPASLTKAPGTLSVAVYDDFAPFALKGKGIDVDLAEVLAKKLGLKLSVMPFPAGDDVNDDLRNMVWKGHYMGYGPADVMLHVPVEPGLKAQNDKVTIFAPYYRDAVRLVRDKRKIPKYDGLDSLTGKKIGVEQVTIGAMLMLGAEDGKFRDDIKILPSAAEALQKLSAGELDGVVANRSEIESIVGKDSNFVMEELAFQRLPVKGWVIGMAVKKDNVDLTRLLQEATDQMIASGEMKELFAHYGLSLVLP